MKNLGEIMFSWHGTDVYLCDDDDAGTDHMRLSFVDGNLVASFDMDADQLQRLADAMYEHRWHMFKSQEVRCPECGYSWKDAQFHNDHRNCSRYPFFPDERGKNWAREGV